MITTLFPPEVAVAYGDIGDDARLLPAEEALTARMAPGRRREFAAGRACARRALAGLGFGPVPLLRGPRRAPRWPEGVVGSITHTEGWCAAAVARADRFAGIGLDAEPLEPLSERALARVCSERERIRLAALPELSPARWGKVVFSAKECLFKAYFPSTQHFLGFADVDVELEPDPGRFLACLTHPDAPPLAGRRRFEGRFARWDELVVTALALPY